MQAIIVMSGALVYFPKALLSAPAFEGGMTTEMPSTQNVFYQKSSIQQEVEKKEGNQDLKNQHPVFLSQEEADLKKEKGMVAADLNRISGIQQRWSLTLKRTDDNINSFNELNKRDRNNMTDSLSLIIDTYRDADLRHKNQRLKDINFRIDYLKNYDPEMTFFMMNFCSSTRSL